MNSLHAIDCKPDCKTANSEWSELSRRESKTKRKERFICFWILREASCIFSLAIPSTGEWFIQTNTESSAITRKNQVVCYQRIESQVCRIIYQSKLKIAGHMNSFIIARLGRQMNWRCLMLDETMTHRQKSTDRTNWEQIKITFKTNKKRKEKK